MFSGALYGLISKSMHTVDKLFNVNVKEDNTIFLMSGENSNCEHQ